VTIPKIAGVALWLCVVAVTLHAAEGMYHSKQLHPERLRVLKQRIDEERAAVVRATDAETKARCQEQLCKSLIQAEEYDQALRVARDVYRNTSVSKERRAAHHFLVARIYAWKMEASNDLFLMETNRQKAVRASQEVVQQNYPSKWMVSEAAELLLEQLQDPAHLREVVSGVRKRQPGGSSPEDLAEAQSRSLEKAMRSSAAYPRGAVVEPSYDAKHASGAGGDGMKAGPVPGESPASTQTARMSKIHFSGGGETVYSAKQDDNSASNSGPRRIKPLRAPIIIDGITVRRAPTSPSLN
jgi:hypothetical protein